MSECSGSRRQLNSRSAHNTQEVSSCNELTASQALGGEVLQSVVMFTSARWHGWSSSPFFALGEPYGYRCH